VNPSRVSSDQGPAWRLEPDGEPRAAGIDGAVVEQMAAMFADAVQEQRLFSGAQMALYRHGRRVLDVGGGIARPRVATPVTPDTMFVIFSATKGLAALAMWMLHERGAFDFDDPVVKYWPTFASQVPEKADVTIRHVMGHRGGFPNGPDWFTARWWGDRDAMVRAMEEVPLTWTPGEANGYHALNFGWVLNELCMRTDAQGRDMGRFLRDEAFAPLGITGAYVGMPDDDALELRVAWAEEPEEPLQDAMTTAAAAAPPGGDRSFSSPVSQDRHRETPELSIPWNRPSVHRAVVPGAGGVATARDLARIYAALALGGELDGVRILSRESVEQAIVPTNAAGDVDRTIEREMRWGTGWHIGTATDQLLAATGRGGEELARPPATMRTFGHGGRGGQMSWADLDRGLAFAFVTTGQLRTQAYRAWLNELQSLAVQACRD
jgi:CubicO group peptidase (beta-lactamase class C family)